MEASRKRSNTARGGVVAGSVWESRMKSDEVKGGIKVFNGEENPEETSERKLRPKQSPIGVNGKRKTWKSENSDGFERNPIQIARQRSEPNKDLDEQLRKSADGIRKSPVQTKKTRSEVGLDGGERSPVQKMKSKSEESKEIINVSVDKIERNPVQIRKAKSESQKLVGQFLGNSDGIERNSSLLRKVKSELHKGSGESVPIPLTKGQSVSSGEPNRELDEIERNSIPMKEENSIDDSIEEIEKNPVGFEKENPIDDSIEEIEKNPLGFEKARSDETCKELDVCEEKVISTSLSQVGLIKSAPEMVDDDDDDDEIEIEEEKKRFEVKEIDVTEHKPKILVDEGKKLHQSQEKSVPKISPIVMKQVSPSVSISRTHSIPTKPKSIPVSSGFQRAPETSTGFEKIPETHSKLQSLVDLVMWRDVSKSAFVFGIGTFIIFSSSYAKDLNLSLITVVSYLGLVYLAAIFLFRSIICRGVVNEENTSQDYVVGEEEAVWLLEMVLPYLNEFLLKLRALFSGDPATTMKMAVLLFVLARCGSSITVWKMTKLSFFGVFTVPKICSSYSPQLTAYGKFWVRRFKDAWESCSHKKPVAFGIFTLVWNLSSVVARIWAVFMLYVAFRYYQQSVLSGDWVEEEPISESTWQAPIGGRRRGRGPTAVELKKDKKRF